jgi:hypothetical protein
VGCSEGQVPALDDDFCGAEIKLRQHISTPVPFATQAILQTRPTRLTLKSFQFNALQPEHQNGAVISFRENRPVESIFGPPSPKPVLSFPRITLENNNNFGRS